MGGLTRFVKPTSENVCVVNDYITVCVPSDGAWIRAIGTFAQGLEM